MARNDDKPETPIDSDEQFTNPSCKVRKINGEEVQFYSLSIQAAKQLRSLAKPLGRALSILFGGIGQEVGGRKLDKKVTTITKEGEHQEIADNTEEVEPIKADLAQLKLDSRAQAVEDAINTLLEDKNVVVVITLCMDSQRTTFDRKLTQKEKELKAKEIEAKLDLSTLTQWLLGMAAANSTEVGPLLARLAGGEPGGSDKPTSTPKSPGT